MNREELRTKFPSYFPIEKLPDGAKEQDIEVYRICKWGRVEQKAFLTSYEERRQLNQHLKEFEGEPDIDELSMSCYEKLTDAQKRLAYFSKIEPKSILAKGTTDGAYGPSQRTRERKPKVRPKSHVDWWLYANADVHNTFEEVTDDENTRAILL